jgi:hypothetical protein
MGMKFLVEVVRPGLQRWNGDREIGIAIETDGSGADDL